MALQRFRQTGCGLVVLALGFVLSGCAGDYVARTKGVRQAYQLDHPDKALAELAAQQKEGEHQIDRLLYLMDEGMLLHAAGRYEESNQKLAQAEKLAAEIDAVSVSEEAKILVSNERERAYRGEDFEKLLLNVFQALNYAELGKDEDALVEARRVNERLRKMIQEEKKPYEQLAIANYLAGVLWEDQHDDDAAIIDYQAAYKVQPELGALGDALVRLAKKTGRDDLYAELKKRFPNADETPLGKGESQIVVVVEAGLSPEKINVNKNWDGSEGPTLIAIPVYRDRWRHEQATVKVDNQEHAAVTVTSIEEVAKVHLDSRVGRMVGKQLAAMAVRAGLAAGVGAATKSQELGALAFVLLSAANQPDLRAWMSLPAEFQVARFRVPPGQHEVTITAGGKQTNHPVQVGPGRVSLVVVRRY